MSDQPEELTDWRSTINHPAMAPVLRAARTVVRGSVYFIFCFVEIVAELLAPIALICGVGWSLLPHILRMVEPSNGQAAELVRGIAAAVPDEITLGGSVLSPGSLIATGLLLIAVVALCRTFQAMVVTDA